MELSGKDKKVLFAVVAAVALSAGGAIFYLRGKVEQATQTPTPAAHESRINSPTASVRREINIPFDYEVVRINNREAVLAGDKGELTISDSNILKVYRGTQENAQPAAFSDLSLGQKLRLKSVPGQSISLYILQ